MLIYLIYNARGMMPVYWHYDRSDKFWFMATHERHVSFARHIMFALYTEHFFAHSLLLKLILHVLVCG